MYDYNAPIFGMHLLWWCFWLFIWVGFFSLFFPVRRSRWQSIQETPLDTLKRRLAKGEIDEQDYERRKTILERDSRQDRGSIPPGFANVPAAIKT
jgi:putative membrane protein